VANGTVVFTTGSGHALAYNANAGGGQLWNVTPGGSLTTPLIVSGSVYFGSTNQNVYALSLANGNTQWSNNPNGVGFVGGPGYAHGLIYIGANDGIVYAFDTTGNNPWNNGNGTAYQSPVSIANGVVYAGSNDFGIYAFDSSNGNILWSGSTNGQVKASPVVVNGTLYVASADGHVYSYGISSTNRPERPVTG
jgi:outer membrane protein assembly factor BamB